MLERRVQRNSACYLLKHYADLAYQQKNLANLTGFFMVIVAAGILCASAQASPLPSATTLRVTSGGGSVTSIPAFQMVTLTATVTQQNGSPASPGLITFCDASYPVCANSAVLGAAQLTSTGTAVLKFFPGIGVHSYVAAFGGNTTHAASTSSPQPLTVKSSYPTTTALVSSGNPGSYTLTGTVSGIYSPAALTASGTVNFKDITNNVSLGEQPLGDPSSAFTFGLPATSTTGDEPGGIAVADFNGDGKLDVAVANSNFGDFARPGNALTILLGNGGGTFTPAPVPTINAYADAVVSADFNNDGKPDLALVTSQDNDGNANAVILLLGNGDGTFTTGATVPVGNEPGYIATGDFNHDGNADLAVTNTQDKTVSILLGDGTAHFLAVAPLTASASPEFLLAADLDGDGISDLAIAYDTNISILLSNGDGTFKNSTSLATSAEVIANGNVIAAGDFNGDGKTDLAVANYEDTATSNILYVDVYLGQGDGTFTESPAAIKVPGHSDAFSLTSLDANEDGKTDLIFSNDQTTGLYLSNGDGTFTPSANSNQIVNSSPNYSYLAAGDFNRDGVPDFAVVEADNDTVQAVLLQAATTATASISQVTGGITAQAEYSGDANFISSISPALVLPGAAAEPAVSLAPATLTFGAQNVGSASAAQTVTLTNTGQAPLTITSVAATGDFAQTNQCGSTVAPGASCGIAVTFSPTASGDRTSTLTITDNAANSPQTLALDGAGSAVSLSSSTRQLTVAAAGGSATATVQIASSGGFSGNVTLTCAVIHTGSGTSSDLPSCSLNPSQAQVSSSAPVSTTLTVTTTADSASARAVNWLLPSGTALATLLFCVLVPRRGWREVRLCILCAALLISIAGCGGGSKSKPPVDPGTSTGNYNVTLAATSGTVKTTATFPLVVQ